MMDNLSVNKNIPSNNIEEIINGNKSDQQIIVLSSPKKAEVLSNLEKKNKILYLPYSETLPYDFFSPSKQITNNRIVCFSHLKQKKEFTLITSIQALIGSCPPKETLFSIDSLEVGKHFNRDKFINMLVGSGYSKNEIVSQLGQFAVRGQIIDVFASGNRLPIRIEEFDNKIISLRFFNIKNQTTIRKIERFDALVPSEYQLNKESVNIFKKNWRLNFNTEEDDCEIFESISNQKITEGAEIYSTLFSDTKSFLFDYLNPECSFFIEEGWENSLESYLALAKERYENYRYDLTRPLLAPEEIFLQPSDVHNFLDKRIKNQFIFINSKKEIINKREDKQEIEIKDQDKFLPDIGDKVVHLNYGIGIFNGLKQINTKNVINECLEIEYENKSKVFVPIDNIDKLTKFFGPIDTKIDSLGSKKWKRKKADVLKKTYDTAAELLEIKARRNIKRGFSYDIPEKEYLEFKKLFPYQETKDQEQTIQEVEKDLSSNRLTDRLICGEVGFGKTEVALRASFIAVYNERQVCILVPTTLLAQQHYETFSERFKNFPVQIAKLSRNLNNKNKKKVLKDLKEGQIDILIGTHAILQKEKEFNNLGLLIIDEEHRFGVKQKEKIVSFKENVEILSLSATPIPRSMNLSLSKLKDLSIIATPPEDRVSVKTFVHSFNENLINEAIQREILRGGQIYYLCNDLRLIEDRKQRLEDSFPNEIIEIVHGQLRAKEIEEKMLNFLNNQTKILVCSTIIESGIDISNANTLIVEDSDKLGLGQLHQLRGRVGRTNKQAFAYFLRSKNIINKSKSNARLKALQDSNSLTAGFLLAMKDLEIRGAGEVLGSNQSGVYESIGIDLYMKLLNKASNYIKDGVIDFEYLIEKRLEIDLGVSSYIPEDYIPEIGLRLIFYNKIATSNNFDDLKKIKIEMIDRFGLFPKELRHLLLEAEIRITFDQNRIESILFKKDEILIKGLEKSERLNVINFNNLDDKVKFLLERRL